MAFVTRPKALLRGDDSTVNLTLQKGPWDVLGGKKRPCEARGERINEKIEVYIVWNAQFYFISLQWNAQFAFSVVLH